MPLESLNNAVLAALPTTFTAPLSGLEVTNGLPATEQTPAEIAAQQARKIAELEAALSAQILLGNNRDVVLPDGETLPVKAATRKLEDMSVWVQVEALKANRYIAELSDAAAASEPVAASRPLLADKDAAIRLMGRTAWEGTTNAQKAAILDIRKGDMEKLRPETYFGGQNTSRAAHELQKANPGQYKLLRLQAVQLGLVV